MFVSSAEAALLTDKPKLFCRWLMDNKTGLLITDQSTYSPCLHRQTLNEATTMYEASVCLTRSSYSQDLPNWVVALDKAANVAAHLVD
jgi:hypothetical protein